ncbi:MAG: efflux RND transporter periplasmic adaptor subunit [Bacteroidetes bacterium]|nr:efflux RND transporter periplasmic adaptor subunit [Bacteroidota bacterium]MBS1934070.1 efflux RND transporter periplasmic adaptor subunit [Bacteroidota bacterium]
MSRYALNIVLPGIILMCSCQQKQPPANPPVPVNLLTVDSKSVLYYDNYPATTVALSQVDIRPQVQGYITGIFFTEGTHVHKGQKLYEIDERLYKAAYDQAVANVKVAQGNLVQAQQDAKRYQYLDQHNAVAKQTLDHAVIAQQNADNEVKAAEQAQKTAATNLTYSVITAPFDGTIGFSQVKLGNFVSVGATTLNTVSTDNPMAVDFLINEAQLPYYEELQKGKKKTPDSLFTIILPNGKVYPQIGKISVIDRAVDPQTGTIRVRLVFPNPQFDLRAGMSCIVRVHNLESTPQIVVPGKAVVEQMGEYFVFVAKDTVWHSSADSPPGKREENAEIPKLRAFQVKVQLGQTIGANVIIKSGLNDGDKIVVDGVQAIHEGSVINASGKPSGKSDTTTSKK